MAKISPDRLLSYLSIESPDLSTAHLNRSRSSRKEEWLHEAWERLQVGAGFTELMTLALRHPGWRALCN